MLSRPYHHSGLLIFEKTHIIEHTAGKGVNFSFSGHLLLELSGGVT